MSSKVKLAADYIHAHIQDGSWPLNSCIPSEHELCAELGISRTSVRGAIAQYVSVGVLESQHGKGTFVRSSDLSLLGGGGGAVKSLMTLEEQMLVHQARQLVEGEMMAFAAEHATPELIEQLEQCCQRMVANLGNQQEFIRADMDYHRTLMRFMNNHYISDFYEPLLDRDDVNRLSNDMYGFYDGIQSHQLFLDAIRERNPDKVRRLAIDYHNKKEESMQDIRQRAGLVVKTGNWNKA